VRLYARNWVNEEIEILIDGYIRGDFLIPPETPEEYRELFELQ